MQKSQLQVLEDTRSFICQGCWFFSLKDYFLKRAQGKHGKAMGNDKELTQESMYHVPDFATNSTPTTLTKGRMCQYYTGGKL